MSVKQDMIESIKHSIKVYKGQIEEYSKPCNSKVAQGRTAHREWLKKKVKKLEKQLKELKDER